MALPTVNLRMYAAAQATHPRMHLLNDKGSDLVVPYAPGGYDLGGVTRTWAEIERPTRKTVLVDVGPGLQRLSFTLTVARTDGSSINDILGILMAMANVKDSVVTITGLSEIEAGPWRWVDCKMTVTKRQHGSNEPLIAEVEFSFVEVASMNTKIARSKK